MLQQPINLITGVPGAGKTLRALHEGIELAKNGHEVFTFGLDGLNTDKIRQYFGVEIIDITNKLDISKWRELPSGSVLIVDEAHKFFPVRQPGKAPEFISDLTEIRHYGIILILVTQDARNIDSFVRRLVGEHLHVSRKAGLSAAMVRTFQGVADDVNDFTLRQSSTVAPWSYDKRLYECYTSSTLHVIKPKIPKKIWFAGFLALLIICAVPYVIYTFKSSVSSPSAEGKKSPSPSSQNSSSPILSSTEKSPWDSGDDFIKAHTPLFPVAPWSAPIYKDLKPTSVPKILCIASGYENAPDRTCNCYTEQVTRIHNIPKPICEIMVRDGQYNPYAPISTPSPVGVQAPANVDAGSAATSVIPSPLSSSFEKGSGSAGPERAQ